MLKRALRSGGIYKEAQNQLFNSNSGYLFSHTKYARIAVINLLLRRFDLIKTVKLGSTAVNRL